MWLVETSMDMTVGDSSDLQAQSEVEPFRVQYLSPRLYFLHSLVE